MHLLIERAAPLSTVQDSGRPGMLWHGISASGPMDRRAFTRCGAAIGATSTAGIEFTTAGFAFTLVGGETRASAAGGDFILRHNGEVLAWPAVLDLKPNDRIDIRPGPAGNYGYLRFAAEIDVPLVLGSRSTSSIAGLGGLLGQPLDGGNILPLRPMPTAEPAEAVTVKAGEGPIRVLWGVHADLFPTAVRQGFVASDFVVSPRLDRMGVRLLHSSSVFAAASRLSLVSEAIVPGDIQILGDGTPVVLMRDHQPTGGYPRIATVISADLDRFAQMRPGTSLRFVPVTLEAAQAAMA